MIKALISTIVIITFFISNITNAAELTIDDILKGQQPPAGVVFEIVSGQQKLLDVLLPRLKHDITRLRKRFPDLSIAIVTHGLEQFALTSKNSKSSVRAHSIVKQLVNEDEIKVHICETFASWQGVSAEDFPDYVDVAPAGPAQINNYLELDYKLITLP